MLNAARPSAYVLREVFVDRTSSCGLLPALFSNWHKESWQTFEETCGYVRPEWVNKWPNCMTYDDDDDIPLTATHMAFAVQQLWPDVLGSH